MMIAPAPESEAGLAADLMAGRVATLAYHDAMEAIAQADDLSHPLLVTGDDGHDVS